METMKFFDKLTRSNTDVRGLAEYLGVKGIDFDDIDVDGKIFFSLVPDYRSYGLDGIEVKVTTVTACITWEVEAEYYTEGEIAQLVAIGGTELRNGKIEGQVSLIINEGAEGWEIEAKDVEFKPSGSVGIDNVEFELGGEGVKHITVS